MKAWGVAIASERRMRAEAQSLVDGSNLTAEVAPFSFTQKEGGEEIRAAPIAYVPNLWQRIEDLFNQNDDEEKR